MSDMDHFASHELMRAMDSMMPVAKSDGRTQGKVTKVEPDGTVWVALRDSRGTVEMPCKRSVVAAKPGDTVAVTVRERRAIVESNISSPAATVEQTSELVKSSAQQVANDARQLYQGVISDAQAAHEAAGRAEKDAQSAADSADRAAVSAANSERFAASSEESATVAKAASTSAVRDALSANVAANGAISSLGTVQDIMGTLEWMQRNRMFVAAQPPFDATIRYYHVTGDEYTAVESPVACDLGDYYEIRPPYHAPTYDDAPVEGKVYYELVSAHYEAVAEPRAEDMGSYAEIIGGVYTKTQDTEPVEGKTYYVLVASRFEAVDSPEETDGLYEVRPGGYALTDDKSIVEGKQYYSLGQGTYAAVTSPTAKDLATYFELSGGLYAPTRDAQVDSAKTYYRLDTGSYAPVRRANAERLATYLTIDPKSTMADFMESHLALSQRGLYITQSKAIVNADGTIAFPPGQASYYMLLGHDGMVLFDALGHEVAHYGESAGQDGVWSATSMEASMFAIQRKVEMPDGSIAKEDVFRVGITDDGQQVLHFMLPVPISEGGTGARSVIEARDNLKLNSIRYTTTSSSAGYIKVKINSKTSWMLALNISLYQSYKNYVIRISGYNYSTTGTWHAPAATMVSASENEAVTVYFGHDSANDLWVAFPAGQYTGVEISAVTNGYTNVLSTFALQDLFTITRVSSLSGTTDKTVAVRRPVYRGESLAVSEYGTGSTTAAGARANLGVPGMTYDSGSKHWLITQPDGGNGNWWRVGTAGIIPPSADTTNKTGKASIGAYGWYFASAYVINYYGNWAGNTIPVGKGGSGITSNPSMLVNLGSSSAASVFQTSPRPGVTGTLPLANLPSQVSSWQGVWVAPISIHPTGQGTPIGFFRRGGFGFVVLAGCKLGRFTTRQTVCALPTGYGNACSSYSAPKGGHLMIEGGYLKADPELLTDPTWGQYLSLAYPIS